ncbi:MAG: multidrug efflux SMR transporter [Bacteroidales bacterium]|nr:multidrug efflux SMR transporter [Bacteroidales bacterium]
MPWVYLLIAGVLEITFTTCLKLSNGFTKIWPSLGFLVASVFSFVFLNFAIKSIPIGTAYAVWTGIGAAGTATIGILWFKEPATTARLLFLVLLIGSVIGLKLVSK